MSAAVDIPEISDLITDYEVATLARRAVSKAKVMAQFEALGDLPAMRVVESMPATSDGSLDPDAVDAALIRAHRELQRLHEEFYLGHRVLEVLVPMIRAFRTKSPGVGVRVIDVGSGLGYLVRWLAAKGGLGDDVELRGYDFNAALVAESQRLSEQEALPCRFEVGNAFAGVKDGDSRPTVFLSTGVLHHFRGEGLVSFFRNQAHADAFFHFDIEPSWLAPMGAWFFHRARMREPVARQDGVRSALRAHTGATLLRASRAGAPEHQVTLFRVGSKLFPLTRTIRPVVGVAPQHWDAWRDELGSKSRLIREQA